MARNVKTTFAAHAALPFALLLVLTVAQGGSCRKRAAEANAAKASNPAAVKASNPTAAKASNAAAGANGNAGVAGKGEAAVVNKMSETTSSRGGGDVAAGSWGGQHVRLEVKSDGAEVEFDCAHGRINARLRPDADGRFDAAGTFVAERGGPVREGASEEGRPARYTGQVKGKTMTLSVRLTDSDTDVGTFTLTRGQNPELVKCL